jgi:ribosome maturation factor RimP
MAMAGVTSGLYRTVETTVGGLGYQLVDVERLGGGLLRVTLDADKGVGLDDCERVSRQLSHLFAVEDVDYQRLEVSSPGLDRPLKNAADFRRFVGSEINVQLYTPAAAAGGRRRMRGRLLQVQGREGAEWLQLQLIPDQAPTKAGRRAAKPRQSEAVTVIDVPMADVEKARLVPELNFRPAREAGAKNNESSSGVNSNES